LLTRPVADTGAVRRRLILAYRFCPTTRRPTAKRRALVPAGSGVAGERSQPAEVYAPTTAVALLIGSPDDAVAEVAGPVGFPTREPKYAIRCQGPTLPVLSRW